jgi:hypothetical protein
VPFGICIGKIGVKVGHKTAPTDSLEKVKSDNISTSLPAAPTPISRHKVLFPALTTMLLSCEMKNPLYISAVEEMI